jgi:ankyrin repeat protein
MADANGQDWGKTWGKWPKPHAIADTVRLLIKHGADITAQDKTRSTPLHMASSIGLAECVRLLIEHGADVTAQNETHLTPLHLASSLVSATTQSFLIPCRTDIGE